jgi:hypothetical protein
MKNFLSTIILTIAMLCIAGYEVSAQNVGGVAIYKVSNPLISLSGSYSQPAQYTPVSAGGASQVFPWYTGKDTVTNTGVDTFKGKISGPHENVYTWCHVSGISGANTSCVVKLWASADSGKGVDFVPIYTVTVTATNPVAYYAFTGWNYTNLWWTFTGVGTHVSSWYSGLFVR